MSVVCFITHHRLRSSRWLLRSFIYKGNLWRHLPSAVRGGNSS